MPEPFGVQEGFVGENPTTRNHTAACIECGTVIGRAAEFCWRCGATYSPDEFEANAQQAMPADAPPGNGDGEGSIFGLIDRLRSSDHQFQSAQGIVSPGAASASAPQRAPVFDPPVQAPSLMNVEAPVLPVEPPSFGMPQQRQETSLAGPADADFTFLRRIVHSVADEDIEREQHREHVRKMRRIAVISGLVLLAAVAIVFRQPLRENLHHASSILRAQVANIFGSGKPAAKGPIGPEKPPASAKARPSGTPAPRQPSEPPPGMTVVVQGQPGSSATVLSPGGGVSTSELTGGPTITQGAPRSTMRISVSPSESRAMLVRQVSPVYPAEARARRIQGAVTVRAIVGKDGLVRQVQPVEGDRMLLGAAVDAVKQWVYRPYLRDGQALEVETVVVVEFSLAGA